MNEKEEVNASKGKSYSLIRKAGSYGIFTVYTSMQEEQRKIKCGNEARHEKTK